MEPLVFAAAVTTGPIVLDVPVFSPGEGGTAAFRIPGLVSMPASNSSSSSNSGGGVLMAFAEGRVENCADFGGIHTIVSKRSVDGGRSWSALRTLLDPAALFGNGTCPRGLRDGCEFWDPTPVYDAAHGGGGGALHVLATLSTTSAARMSGRLTLWQVTSADRGASWGAPRNITAQVAHAELGVMTPGNGHGVQLAPATATGGGADGGGGRLLVAGYVRPQGDGSEFCATIASDDGGGSWSLQTAHGAAGNGTSECEVAQLRGTGGLLVMDERMNRDAQAARGGCGQGVAGQAVLTCRWRSTSADGGATWQGLAPVPELPDPSCKGGIAAWAGGGAGGAGGIAALVQSSCGSQSARVNLTLRVSVDGGVSWPAERQVLLSAAAGYSDVQVQAARAQGQRQQRQQQQGQQQQEQQRTADEAAVLYEASACGGIRLAIVALDAIT